MRNSLKFVFCLCLFGIMISAVSLSAQDFAAWLKEIKKQAISKGVSEATVDNALRNVKLVGKTIELDRNQPEKTITLDGYLRNTISQARIRKGKKLLKENERVLREISKKYGVQPRFIIALWGIETDFGRNTGNFYIPAALATLAFEGRRREFFTEELINSLIILDEGHIKIEDMKGSWAGAMGQTQFMPSSFIKHAVDYDGDGRSDIWSTKEDALASIANYLSSYEWDDDTTWGRKVKTPNGFDISLVNIDLEKSLSEWQQLGIRNRDGGNLPLRDIKASLIMPDGEKGDAFLVYDNYKKILKWNRSLYFATAVGLLSDAF